jgi:hypothetical protein
MQRNVVKHLHDRKPFRPMLITLSSGDRFEVRHPEAAYFAEQFMAIAMVEAGEEESPQASMAWIDYSHIAHCQPLKPQPPF